MQTCLYTWSHWEILICLKIQNGDYRVAFCKNLRISWPSSGHLGIKLGNKVRKNALDLKMGRDVEKDLSFFQKRGVILAFQQRHSLVLEKNCIFRKEKECLYQFSKLTLGLRPLVGH